jgi:ferredoxin
MSRKPHRVARPGLMRVYVDRERCQGHARCVAVASELFELDEFGSAHEISNGTVLPDLELKARAAAANCPELAVAILEE